MPDGDPTIPTEPPLNSIVISRLEENDDERGET